MSQIYLEHEFNKIWAKIEKGENFAFARHGDGERSIMMGKAATAQEGWRAPNFLTKLGEDLLQAMNIVDDNFYFGISCPCCDQAAYYWYSTRIASKNITFANLWANSNYIKFINSLNHLRRDVVLIANYRANGVSKIGGCRILRHYAVSDNCFDFWENQASGMIEEIKKDFGQASGLLFMVSAGPMSTLIIAELYKSNPNNCYIDFGSAIDAYYRKEVTRPYMRRWTKYARQKCAMGNPLDTDFNVSVVLNLYKRPDALGMQLEALQNQTLKPSEILLFHDYAANAPEIQVPTQFEKIFSLIEKSKKNMGVWERFRFAQRAKSELVCLLDDDTIPGSRWLENCHAEMGKKEGLYGAIGILMFAPECYPDYIFRYGWANPCNKTKKVDFVGHSWFFKKKWLTLLFDGTDDLQEMKICGEDMTFSYQLLKYLNIETFVPPHPKDNQNLWGSLPVTAWDLGLSNVALSMNQNNLEKYNCAMNKILKRGWRTVLQKRYGVFSSFFLACAIVLIKLKRYFRF